MLLVASWRSRLLEGDLICNLFLYHSLFSFLAEAGEGSAGLDSAAGCDDRYGKEEPDGA